VADGWHKSGAKPLLRNLRRAFPSVKLAWADGDLHTFQVLPRRWVIERTLAWITRCHRTVRDCERLPAHHETIVYWAMTITMTRRLARRPAAQPAALDHGSSHSRAVRAIMASRASRVRWWYRPERALGRQPLSPSGVPGARPARSS
jgi:Transposase DDE domain